MTPSYRQEWESDALAMLRHAASMLKVEAQEWRDRAAAIKQHPDFRERDKEQMLRVAEANEGMASRMIAHVKKLLPNAA